MKKKLEFVSIYRKGFKNVEVKPGQRTTTEDGEDDVAEIIITEITEVSISEDYITIRGYGITD